MEWIRKYLFSLVAASLVCSLARRITSGKSQMKGITDMICGLFLVITVLAPWLNVEIPDIRTYVQEYRYDAESVAEAGRYNASQRKADVIKQEVESYILEKAHTRNMIVDVEVSLDAQTCIPISVEINGDVSPYDRSVLSQYISQTFDIPEELQRWG